MRRAGGVALVIIFAGMVGGFLGIALERFFGDPWWQ